MRILLILTTIFILTSCASRTKYRPYTPSSDGGYVDKVEKAGDVRISEFYGNSKTSLDDVIALLLFTSPGVILAPNISQVVPLYLYDSKYPLLLNSVL